jgi:hypothetical protein
VCLAKIPSAFSFKAFHRGCGLGLGRLLTVKACGFLVGWSFGEAQVWFYSALDTNNDHGMRIFTIYMHLSRMTVSQSETTVNVESSSNQVNVADTSVQGIVDGKQTRDLPLNGRDWTTLATLNTGVSRVRDSNGSLTDKTSDFLFDSLSDWRDIALGLHIPILLPEATCVSEWDAHPTKTGLLPPVNGPIGFDSLPLRT